MRTLYNLSISAFLNFLLEALLNKNLLTKQAALLRLKDHQTQISNDIYKSCQTYIEQLFEIENIKSPMLSINPMVFYSVLGDLSRLQHVTREHPPSHFLTQTAMLYSCHFGHENTFRYLFFSFFDQYLEYKLSGGDEEKRLNCIGLIVHDFFVEACINGHLELAQNLLELARQKIFSITQDVQKIAKAVLTILNSDYSMYPSNYFIEIAHNEHLNILEWVLAEIKNIYATISETLPEGFLSRTFTEDINSLSKILEIKPNNPIRCWILERISIEHLRDKLSYQSKNNINTLFDYSCENGLTNTLIWALEKITQLNLQNQGTILYEGFCKCCSNGQKVTAQWLINNNPFGITAAQFIQHNNFQSFVFSCSSGKIEMMEWLLDLLDENTKPLLIDTLSRDNFNLFLNENDHYFYGTSPEMENRNHRITDRLLESFRNSPNTWNNFEKNIVAMPFFGFLWSAPSTENPPISKEAFIELYLILCKSNSLTLLKLLWDESIKKNIDPVSMIPYTVYINSISMVCKNGYLETLQWLLVQYTTAAHLSIDAVLLLRQCMTSMCNTENVAIAEWFFLTLQNLDFSVRFIFEIFMEHNYWEKHEVNMWLLEKWIGHQFEVKMFFILAFELLNKQATAECIESLCDFCEINYGNPVEVDREIDSGIFSRAALLYRRDIDFAPHQSIIERYKIPISDILRANNFSAWSCRLDSPIRIEEIDGLWNLYIENGISGKVLIEFDNYYIFYKLCICPLQPFDHDSRAPICLIFDHVIKALDWLIAKCRENAVSISNMLLAQDCMALKYRATHHTNTAFFEILFTQYPEVDFSTKRIICKSLLLQKELMPEVRKWLENYNEQLNKSIATLYPKPFSLFGKSTSNRSPQGYDNMLFNPFIR